MTFESSKNMSSIGALLIVLGTFGSILPFAGLLSLVGGIILLIGLRGFAHLYNEEGIFNNVVYSIVIMIVGVVVTVAIMAITAASALMAMGVDLSNLNELPNVGANLTAYFTDFSNITITQITAIIVGLAVLVVFFVISMYFNKKSLDLLKNKSGTTLFGTAGLLMLVGAVLTIVVVGVILIWIGYILATIAFFQMKSPEIPVVPS